MMKKFTIIELLIIISVMIILIALLLPALNSAREKGRTIVCISNLRQNYLALTQYANDNEWYPAAKGPNEDFNKGYWYMKLLPYLGFKSKISGTTGWNTVAKARVYQSLNCPNLVRINGDTAAYAMNGFYNYVNWGLKGAVSISDSTDSASHYVRTDARFSDGRTMSNVTLLGDMSCPKSSGNTPPQIENGDYFDDSRPGDTASMRHACKKNILFMDGTCSTMGKPDLKRSSTANAYKLYYTRN